MVARSLFGSSTLSGSALILSAGALVCAAAPVQADITPVAPYYARVNDDGATLRCGPTSTSYSVQGATAGAIVIVDAEGQGWTRVLYPSAMHAFVRAEDATLNGATVTLSKASQLVAPSQLRGFTGSWKALLETPLPSGATLTHIETVKEGEVAIAYKVQAPAEARAFLTSASIRRATDAEVEAYRAKNTLASLPIGANQPVTGIITTPQRTAIDVPAGINELPTTTTTTTSQTPTSIDVPVTIKREFPNSESPAGTPGATHVPTQAELEKVFTQPKAAEPAPKDTTAETLEPTFQKVWKEPVLTAEVDELIGEYERAITKTDQAGRKAALQRRLDALTLRRDYRETLRRQEADRVTSSAQQTELNQKIQEWEGSRIYTIVGVLQPSTVYDGKDLPQMYRVVSVGGTSPRTLGYIRKTEGVELEKHLGMIVGVIGERELDRSLQLNLITPVRVDPLRSAPESILPATDATPSTHDGPAAPLSDGTLKDVLDTK